MNALLKRMVRKWLGLRDDFREFREAVDHLNGTQYEQHMRLLELERQVSELKPQRDSRGRFCK